MKKFVNVKPVHTKNGATAGPYVVLIEGHYNLVAPETGEVIPANVSLTLHDEVDEVLTATCVFMVKIGEHIGTHATTEKKLHFELERLEKENTLLQKRLAEMEKEVSILRDWGAFYEDALARVKNRNIWQAIWAKIKGG